MKRFVLPLLATVVGGVIMGVLLNRTRTEQLTPMKGRVDIVEAKQDPEIAAAVLRARRELPRFIEALQKPAADQREFAVNARFDTPKGPEQIWVRVTSYKDGVFDGTLVDQPFAIPKLNKGDAVRVPQGVVNDWLFRNGTKIAGGYTMQVLLKRTGKG